MANILPEAAVKAVLLCFYIVGISGFIAILASGTTLFCTHYQLKALADRQDDELAGPGPSNYVSFDDGVLEDGLHATYFRSARATAMKRVRGFALFAPFLTFIPMIVLPLSLQLNNVGDIPIRILLSIVVILLIHLANAATLHSYFGLVQGKETVPVFENGPGLSLKAYAPDDELASSSCLLWIYLRILFTLCGLNIAKLPQFPASVRVALMRKSSSLSTTPLLANEATEEPQYKQADNIPTSDRPPFFGCDGQTLLPSLPNRDTSDSESVTSIELGRQVGT